jgi:hypothetical protein
MRAVTVQQEIITLSNLTKNHSDFLQSKKHIVNLACDSVMFPAEQVGLHDDDERKEEAGGEWESTSITLLSLGGQKTISGANAIYDTANIINIMCTHKHARVRSFRCACKYTAVLNVCIYSRIHACKLMQG